MSAVRGGVAWRDGSSSGSRKRSLSTVRAPTESVLDSRFLLNASEIGTQMARNLKIDTGFEIDDYLKRVASLIGGTLQAASRNALLDDEEDEEGGGEEGWDWQALGRRAAKRTKRAPTLGFLCVLVWHSWCSWLTPCE